MNEGTYESPAVEDLGTLMEITAGVHPVGTNDGGGPEANNKT